ncbi:TIGR03618 family F420-dependent PPOX class oxidoreductase [Allosaccharopolyspora coralli]|uniref:TIGR03618 family F420-dependent PPOX class oxidoreductase n=1 Tax=Allosaccharopolyspora coralli TaxID=2665642 RepID=A0A5Q3QAY0_9PSEU|nr:TIGR03618 family F420-dependent PPOX class oxidoreductase [Allosaccharopolyspora coralli]QGK70364.1 TIGR03618 family F420-dependent PPOX class oxidoreductase [Allosaccharopolyspora coralli]
MSRNRRDLIAMSPAEIDGFLAAQHTLVVATHGARGHPHVAPMWFAWVDGALVFWTYSSAQKVVNLRRDARMSCLVEDGEAYEELRAVHMEGHGRIVSEPDEVQRVGVAIAERYAGTALDEDAREVVRASGRKRVAVAFEPARLISWDHRKLGGRY